MVAAFIATELGLLAYPAGTLAQTAGLGNWSLDILALVSTRFHLYGPRYVVPSCCRAYTCSVLGS